METKAWKWFRYDEIFEIKKGKRLTKADMIAGEIPYIGAIDSNNGISAKIANNEHLHEANTITVSYNGSIAEAFYQSKPFWATDDVNVLYPKFELNEQIAMFLITLIYREKYRFNYGRKWDKELMQQSTIKLPITENGTPDWQWMEDYVKNNLTKKLPQKAKTIWQNDSDTTPLSPQKLELHTENWRWFRVGDLFECSTTPHSIAQELEYGKTPFVSRSALNNGISGYIAADELEKIKNNCITIGAEGIISFYQAKDFVAGVKIYTLRNLYMNKYVAMFICTLLDGEKYRYNYGNARILEKIKRGKILLPATPAGSPDWQFMEDYIKSLPYSGCL